MNIRKLKKLRNFMAKLTEKRVVMSTFMDRNKRDGDDSGVRNAFEKARGGNVCGTVGCIAGWASVLAPKKDFCLTEKPDDKMAVLYDRTAAKWLEIEGYAPTGWMSDWMRERNMFNTPLAIEERVLGSEKQIAIARLDWLIENNGKYKDFDGYLGDDYYDQLRKQERNDG